jgi:hypothetical protein
VCSSPAPDADVQAADDPVFLLGEVAVPDVWPEVIEPPKPAALAASVQACKQRTYDGYLLALSSASSPSSPQLQF